MIKRGLLIASALMLSACSKPSEEAKMVGTGEIKVERLFTHEGCTVYRFTDYRFVHYANCSGTTTTTENYPCGKSTCTRDVSVATNKENKHDSK